MFKLVLVGTIAAMAAASGFVDHPINQDIVDKLKGKVSWKVHEVSENPLAHLTKAEIYGLLGTRTDLTPFYTQNDLSPSLTASTEFDARNQWGSAIHPIRDQASCGSCWAFGATEALSDRFAINGVDVILSPQDPTSCDATCMGCNGGWLLNVWIYMQNQGVVTDACYPYTSGNGITGQCKSACTVAGQTWKKYHATNVVQSGTRSQIQDEIQAHGPAEAAFTVYADFMNYASGVYYHRTGGVMGGHAVKILGWGHDTTSGLDYWLCANSWNTSWGEKGYFKIKVGDCGIDQQVTWGAPDLTKLPIA